MSKTPDADPGMGRCGPAHPSPFDSHANSAYFVAISANFDTLSPLYVNPESGPEHK